MVVDRIAILALAGLLAVVAGCGDSASGGPEVAAEEDASQGQGDSVSQDSRVGTETAEEVGTPEDGMGIDVPLSNTPPTFQEPPSLGLDMGQSTILDLNPYLSDAEDPGELLVLEWSAGHVAMQDPGDHVLYVVAPVDWFGLEVIDVTITDSGGLTAESVIKVMVNEVVVPDPEPDTCGEVAFHFAAGTEAQTVFVSGSFNDWGDSPETADVMTDVDSDGVWETIVVLEPGASYQYKFVADGNWFEDPDNPNKVPDGYGGFNSVTEVPACESGAD